MKLRRLSETQKLFPLWLDKREDSNFSKHLKVVNEQNLDLYNSIKKLEFAKLLEKPIQIIKKQSKSGEYTLTFKVKIPSLKKITIYHNPYNDGGYCYEDDYQYNFNIKVVNESEDLIIIDFDDESIGFYEKTITVTKDESKEKSGEVIITNDVNSIIPNDTFIIKVETYDNYTFFKGYPENDSSEYTINIEHSNIGDANVLTFTCIAKNIQSVKIQRKLKSEDSLNNTQETDIITHEYPSKGRNRFRYNYKLPVTEILDDYSYSFEVVLYDNTKLNQIYPKDSSDWTNIFNHDYSLDVIGNMMNVPRRKYNTITSDEDYEKTSPTYCNTKSEDDYNYQQRIIYYINHYNKTYFPVLEMWKHYNIDSELVNRYIQIAEQNISYQSKENEDSYSLDNNILPYVNNCYYYYNEEVKTYNNYYLNGEYSHDNPLKPYQYEGYYNSSTNKFYYDSNFTKEFTSESIIVGKYYLDNITHRTYKCTETTPSFTQKDNDKLYVVTEVVWEGNENDKEIYEEQHLNIPHKFIYNSTTQEYELTISTYPLIESDNNTDIIITQDNNITSSLNINVLDKNTYSLNGYTYKEDIYCTKEYSEGTYYYKYINPIKVTIEYFELNESKPFESNSQEINERGDFDLQFQIPEGTITCKITLSHIDKFSYKNLSFDRLISQNEYKYMRTKTNYNSCVYDLYFDYDSVPTNLKLPTQGEFEQIFNRCIPISKKAFINIDKNFNKNQSNSLKIIDKPFISISNLISSEDRNPSESTSFEINDLIVEPSTEYSLSFDIENITDLYVKIWSDDNGLIFTDKITTINDGEINYLKKFKTTSNTSTYNIKLYFNSYTPPSFKYSNMKLVEITPKNRIKYITTTS